MSGFLRLAKRPFWIRLLHWEYWSFHVIYLPIYPIWLFLCLRARSLFFFAASNPRIKNGGFLAESKREIYALIPPEFQPGVIFFDAGQDPQTILHAVRARGFSYPLIAKPNVGGKGRGVKKLNDERDLIFYATRAEMDFHIQEYISYEKEMGVFYYRFPGEPSGHISGIVAKEFLQVTGDGRRCVRDLLMLDPRGILQLPELEKNQPALLQSVIPEAEVLTVLPYGNHARGAKFLDDSEHITQALTRMVDSLCRRIPDFYFGRLDIRYRNRCLLEAGKDFMVLELNGAGSEPTHMYDPRHSLFFAWKEIVRHWILLYRISRANHRRGHAYLSFSQGLRMFREDKYYSKQLEGMKPIQ